MEREQIRVLMVEDNPGDARLVEEYLRASELVDFQVTWARRLEEATEKVGSTEYDVILLDLGLPGISGLETFSDMFFFSGDVPIVILTGRSDQTLALTALQDGAQDYIFKSHMEQDALERTLRYAIERHRRQGEMNEIRSMLLKAEAVQVAAGHIKKPLSTIVEISDELNEAAADHPQRQLFEVLSTEVRAIQSFVEKVGDLWQYSAEANSSLESG